jgi:hypothetical protein
MVKILLKQRVIWLLIWDSTARVTYSPPVRSGPNRGVGGSSSAYEAPNATTIFHTRSRWLRDSVLLTFGDGINTREDGGIGAVQPDIDTGGGDFRWSSVFGSCSGSGGRGWAHFSMWRIDARGFGSVARWRRQQWRKVAQFGVKSHGEGSIYRGLRSTHSHDRL